MIRGYNRMTRNGTLPLVARIREELTTTPVCEKSFKVSGLPELSAQQLELSIRQFLLIRLVANNLGERILANHGSLGKQLPLVYPLPARWRNVIQKNGIAVSAFKSQLFWNAYIFAHLLNSIRTLLLLSCIGRQRHAESVNSVRHPYVYFDSLTKNNLPLAIAEKESDHSTNIVTWYLKKFNHEKHLATVCHSVKGTLNCNLNEVALVAVSSPFPRINSVWTMTGIFVWFIFQFFCCLLEMLEGCWGKALLLSELLKAKTIKISSANVLAKEYLFHNSNWIYRPVWTYLAEQKGSKIKFYFYSTNCEKFKNSNEEAAINFGWLASSWSTVMVWDEYQKQFVEMISNSRHSIDVVGIIDFQNSKTEILNLPEKTIAVFDVQPFRETRYKALALDFEYYIPQTSNKFLCELHEVASELNWTLVLKRKRNIGRVVHPTYMRCITELSSKTNWLEVEPSQCAKALIRQANAVVSAPFTSTALIAQTEGVPSVYFDATGTCFSDDRAAHGIPVLKSKEELRAWVASLPT